MASIEKANLEITPDVASRTARVLITCEIHFTDDEMAVMKQKPDRMYFQLFCWLAGQDLGQVASIDTDDWLYAFETKGFPDGSLSQIEQVSFESTLSFSLLNEDIVGEDEIYAKLLLRGWWAFKGNLARGTTNVVRYEFGD